MEIRYIRASELEELARRYAEQDDTPVPITPARAASQVRNPHAGPHSILLLLAMEGERICGYLGILPSRTGLNGPPVYFNTCWWAEPGAGAGVSLGLLSEFMKLSGGMAAFSDLTPRTASIMKGLPGFLTKEREGLLLRFRPAWNKRLKLRCLSGKANPTLKLTWLAGGGRFLDLVFLLPYYLRRRRFYKAGKESSGMLISRALPEEALTFLSGFDGRFLTLPSTETAAWWTGTGWLVAPDRAAVALAGRYYFSTLALSHKVEWYVLKSKDGICGMACVGMRDGLAKTHYLWYAEEYEKTFFESLTSELLKDPCCNALLTYHPAFTPFLKKAFRNSGRKLTRYTAFNAKLEHLEMQDGDGDYVFT